jgi:hypothetical protein
MLRGIVGLLNNPTRTSFNNPAIVAVGVAGLLNDLTICLLDR